MRLHVLIAFLVAILVPLCGSAQIVAQAGIDTSAIRQIISQNALHISNVMISCDSSAYGEFAGNSELPITHGLFLSTGKGKDLFGANTAENTTTSFGTHDTISGLDATNDVCSIEFDARSETGSINFIFSFASEEYPEYVYSPFNDEFKILVSGPRATGGQYINLNMAWLPDNTTTCIAHVNPFSNTNYFYDNTYPQGQFISYDGITSYFYATINVIPDSTYHIAFVIGDENDSYFDSGGFVAAEDSELNTFPAMPASGVVCFPNPVVTELTWLPAPGVTVQSAELYNELGQLVYRLNDPAEERSIDMTGFSCGYYVLHLETTFRTYSFRIIKTE